MAARITITWQDFMVLASIFATDAADRWEFGYGELRTVLINIGFAAIPNVSAALRPTGALAAVDRHAFLYNPNDLVANYPVRSHVQDWLAFALWKRWGLTLRSFYLPIPFNV
ncbi:hypothetical protein C8T65DRAFT_696686 [Cerioporus squamosus]|nr:hypothetical protein C8T65DRAFT_696686 [Cerioporus squamosus]